MQNLLRALIGLVGLFNMVVGLGFMFVPARLAKTFFLSPIGIEGMATLRADFPGFFIASSVFAVLAAARNRADLLLAPVVMIAIALTGRIVSILLDGSTSASFPPLIVEAAMLVLLGVGYRRLGNRA